MKKLGFNKLRNYAGSTAIGLILAALTGCASLTDNLATATPAPSDLPDLLDADIEASRKKLADRGYELVASGLSAKEQYWWNAHSKTCVSLAIVDRHIAALNSIDAAQCATRVKPARRAPAKLNNYVYTDGQAKFNSPDLSAERQQLAYQDYKATYWVKDALSGKGVEYWLSADGTTCTALVFATKDGTLLMMGAGEPDQCVKPGPAAR
ncbi:MAG: hypothetical protein ACU837_12665 [Gammaproteobacteria bacterium]